MGWYALIGQKQEGPFYERKLAKLLADGRVTGETQVWREDGTERALLKDNSELATLLTSASSSQAKAKAAKKNPLGGLIVLAVIIAVVWVGVKAVNEPKSAPTQSSVASGSAQEQGEAKPQGISREAYDAIQTGTTKAEVLRLLGQPDSVSESNIPGAGKIEACIWTKTKLLGAGAQVITISFTNEQVTNKAWAER